MPTKQAHEFGNSLNDFINRVSREFNDQFDYYWVMDVFSDHIICTDLRNERQKYKVLMTRGANGELSFQEQNLWEKVKLDYVKEMLIHMETVSELNHLNIEVPVRSNVDIAQLTEGDTDPFFITLEIAQKNRTSGNGLIYDDKLVKSIVSQINNSSIEGIMGHLSSEERSTAYKPSDVYWLGASEMGDKAYAKGYIPKTAPQAREHFRILKSTGGKAATSIYGWANQEIVDSEKGTWKAAEFNLEQLDLAPHTRAALKPSSNFVITSQMEAKEKMGNEDTNKTVSVTEFEQLQKEIAEFKRKELKSNIGKVVTEQVNWKTSTDEGKEVVKAFKLFIAEYASHFSKTEDEARTVIETVLTDLKPVTELIVKALSGPLTSASQKQPKQFADTPEARQKARSEFNLLD